MFGNHYTTAVPTLVLNGATATNNFAGPANNPLNNLNLNSGTLTSTTGNPNGGGYGAWNINGTVTATGASLITTSGSNGQIMLASGGITNTTFNVVNPADALTIATGILNGRNTASPYTSYATSLTKTGSGLLSITGSATYSGGTTISGGTLAIGGSGALGNGNYAGPISGSGAFLYNSTANQTLSGGNNSFTGNTTVSSGTLAFSPPSATAWNLSGNKSVAAGAVLNLNLTGQAAATQNTIGAIAVNGTWNIASNAPAVDGSVFNTMTLSGSGTINVNGPGEVEFGSWTGANNDISGFSGVINVASGIFGLNNQLTGSLGAHTLGSANLDFRLQSGATFDLRVGTWVANLLSGSGTITATQNGGILDIGRGNGSSTFGGIIGGGNLVALTKEGTGMLTLNGANTYGGATTISGGTLRTGNLSALGTGAVSIASGGLLDLYGNSLTIGSLATSTGTITDTSPARAPAP